MSVNDQLRRMGAGAPPKVAAAADARQTWPTTWTEAMVAAVDKLIDARDYCRSHCAPSGHVVACRVAAQRYILVCHIRATGDALAAMRRERDEWIEAAKPLSARLAATEEALREAEKLRVASAELAETSAWAVAHLGRVWAVLVGGDEAQTVAPEDVLNAAKEATAHIASLRTRLAATEEALRETRAAGGGRRVAAAGACPVSAPDRTDAAGSDDEKSPESLVFELASAAFYAAKNDPLRHGQRQERLEAARDAVAVALYSARDRAHWAARLAQAVDWLRRCPEHNHDYERLLDYVESLVPRTATLPGWSAADSAALATAVVRRPPPRRRAMSEPRDAAPPPERAP